MLGVSMCQTHSHLLRRLLDCLVGEYGSEDGASSAEDDGTHRNIYSHPTALRRSASEEQEEVGALKTTLSSNIDYSFCFQFGRGLAKE